MFTYDYIHLQIFLSKIGLYVVAWLLVHVLVLLAEMLSVWITILLVIVFILMILLAAHNFLLFNFYVCKGNTKSWNGQTFSVKNHLRYVKWCLRLGVWTVKNVISPLNIFCIPNPIQDNHLSVEGIPYVLKCGIGLIYNR